MKGKKTFRVASLVIVLCFILTSTVFASAKNKIKFEKNNNFKWNKSTNYMRDKGIMKGYDNGDFGFTDYVKRGDITVMIVRAFKISTMLGDIEKFFPDVSVDSYYYDAIATAKYYGIAKGDGKHFNPKKYVTIGEAIALIERSATVANSNVVLDQDVDIRNLYKDKDLDKYATRDDIAKMLYYVLTGDIYDGDNDESDNDKDKGIIVYETKNDIKITFDEDDFKDAFYSFKDVDKNDKLDYVKFKLPSSAYGKLYYDYVSTSKYKSLVTDNKAYDYDDIDLITFVPASGYKGSVSIDYRAYDVDGASYTGKIKIIINEEKLETVDLDTIKYTINKDTKIAFDSDDFKDVLEDATDEDFDYVKFTLPDEKYGKLYYDYESTSKYKSLVIDTKSYDNDDVDIITFIPASGYEGNVYIDYTAYDEDGKSYLGKIKIIVK